MLYGPDGGSLAVGRKGKQLCQYTNIIVWYAIGTLKSWSGPALRRWNARTADLSCWRKNSRCLVQRWGIASAHSALREERAEAPAAVAPARAIKQICPLCPYAVRVGVAFSASCRVMTRIALTMKPGAQPCLVDGVTSCLCLARTATEGP